MGVIMHNNIPYGGGSSIEPNPQESATEQLETLGIDGDVYEVTDANAIHTSDVGVANGVAELDANGFVPSSQLPSYVDDVLEYASRSAFPATGETGKIYVALDTNLTYRWGGSDYVEISPSLALGETSSTAYRGDRGKIAYDHSQSDHSGIKPAFTEASTRANIASGETIATIFGKIKKFFSDLKTVAFTGAYSDLSGTPTIPTVNNGTLTIQKNGTQVATFSANQSGNATANITVPEVGETDTTNSTPYLYRASQNSGDRCYLRQLIGASFGVNQLFPIDSYTYSNKGYSISCVNGKLTVTGTSQESAYVSLFPSSIYQQVKPIQNHKYLLYCVGTHNFNYLRFSIYGDTIQHINLTAANNNTTIINCTSTNTTDAELQAYRVNGSSISGTIQTYFADLTQMFGTAIADKAYTMEQTTAGSGIAWLKSYGFFTESYYPYNAGSLVSVQTSRKVNTEKNLFDPSQLFEVSGLTENNGEYVFSKADMIAVFGDEAGGGFYPRKFAENTQYTISMKCYNERNGFTLYFRHTDGTTISQSTYASSWASFTFTSTAGKTVEKLYFSYPSYGTVHWKEIQFEKGSTATPYKPYTPHTTQLPNIELRGVAQLSGNDIVYDGDVENADGSVGRNYTEINLDNMASSIEFNSGTNCWLITVSVTPKSYGSDGIPKMMSSAGYIPAAYSSDKSNNKMGVDLWGHLFVGNNSSSTKPTGKIVYEVATPTTEHTTPIQNPQIYNSNGTEQFIDNRTVPIPVGHNSEYVNLPDWMEDGYYKDFRQRVDEHIGSDGNFNGNALTATLATKATQDGDGNTISSTYAKKPIYSTGSVGSGKIGVQKIAQITLSEVGTYYITGWARFTGGGKKAVQLWCAGPLGESWEDSTIAVGEPKTFSTFAIYTSSVAGEVVKVNSYTVSNSNAVTGGLVAFKIA